MFYLQRQGSIITLSSNRSVTTPTPPGATLRGAPSGSLPVNNPNKLSISTVGTIDERTVIASNTRSIVALAAKRKNDKVHGDILSMNDANLNKTYTSLTGVVVDSNKAKNDADNYLTQSRLAQHDRKYGSTVTIQQLIDGDSFSQVSHADHNSIATDIPIKKPSKGQRLLYRQAVIPAAAAKKKPINPLVKNTTGGGMYLAAPKKNTKRAKSQDYAGYQQVGTFLPIKMCMIVISVCVYMSSSIINYACGVN